jgi:NADPH-dependent 2,4-dienoyl-CoA reductase/sulfur reductase-like enzyme/rhodanese-related sulfurtransferase
MPLKVLIVGGVAGGAGCAARLRRLDESAEIVLLEKDEYVSFANCGLPYYIGGVIQKRNRLLIQTPAALKRRFNIDVRVRNEAVRIDKEAHSVEIKNLETGDVYRERYDKLVLSPGAMPIIPRIPGADHARVYTLRNIPDTDKIKKALDEKKPRNAVIIGAGFIGLEMADNLHGLGIDVRVVEMADHVLPVMDFDMSAIVHKHIVSKGVAVHIDDGVTAIRHEGDKSQVELAGGTKLDADMIIMSIGVRPVTKLAVDAGLRLGVTGGISVNENLQTSDPDIYAVGDAIEVKNFVTGAPSLIPLAGPANRQGRIAADNIAGRNEKYTATLGTAIVKVFELAVATTGISESMAKRIGMPHKTSIFHAESHATYYPGAELLSIKTIFDPENGKILGAQVIGSDKVDKTIDAFAIAIKAGMTVYDLQDLELAYAPPFSGAKSPVNIAGFIGANILKGDVDVISWDELEEKTGEDAILLDVRTPRELAVLGSVEGAVNIPVDDLRARVNELPKDKEINIYCKIGIRAYFAVRILKQMGFRARNIGGGYQTYQPAAEVRKRIKEHNNQSIN